jgi:hypothetical protein
VDAGFVGAGATAVVSLGFNKRRRCCFPPVRRSARRADGKSDFALNAPTQLSLSSPRPFMRRKEKEKEESQPSQTAIDQDRILEAPLKDERVNKSF